MEAHSYIELQPGAMLSIYVNGSINMADSFIGGVRSDRNKFDTSGGLAYFDPDHIHIFTPSTGVVAKVSGQCVIVGNVYGSRLTLNLGDSSALYGRVASRFLTMTGESTIFYDNALNSGVGYTNPDSLIYQSDGHMKAGVLSLASLNSAALQSLADALTATISGLFGFLFPSGGGGGGAYSVGPTDPTPRTVNVAVTGRVEGNDYANWESKADGALVLVHDTGSGNAVNVKTRSPGHITIVP